MQQLKNGIPMNEKCVAETWAINKKETEKSTDLTMLVSVYWFSDGILTFSLRLSRYEQALMFINDCWTTQFDGN